MAHTLNIHGISIEIYIYISYYIFQLSKNCSKCFSEISQGGIDDYTGELVCTKCVTQSQIHLEENSFITLQKITGLHLDDLKCNICNVILILLYVQYA